MANRSRGRRRLVMSLLSSLLCATCTGAATTASPTPSPTATPATASPSATLPSPTPVLDCVHRVFASLTDEQRVGQLFMIGLANDRLGPIETGAIRAHHFGSVTFVVTTTEGVASVKATTRAVKSLAAASTAGIRFFVAANQEGGLIQALRGPGFSTIPSAVDQGRMDPATLETNAVGWGRELLSAGVNLNFAPVLDVVPLGTDAQNQPIGVLKREYGHDPATVTVEGTSFLTGMVEAGVSPTAKHFPGLGRVEGNTDFTADVVDDVTTPDDPYLEPFQEAIRDGVPLVMVALATYTRIDPDHQAVFSPTIMRILRQQMHFSGVIVSDEIGDAEAVQAIPAGTRAIEFITAGGDMIVSKTVPPAVTMAKAVLGRMGSDQTFRARVDEAVMTVLATKRAAGLLPCR